MEYIASMLEKVFGKFIERRYMSVRRFDVPVSVLSNELARAKLQWLLSTPMHDGLSRTVEWMKGELATLALGLPELAIA